MEISQESEMAEEDHDDGESVLYDKQGFPVNLDPYEEPLDFEPPEIHGKGKYDSYSKRHKEELRAKGIKIRRGTFTTQEDKILKRNYKKFAKVHNLKNPHILLGINSRNTESKKLKRYKRITNFYYRLAKNLNDRTIHTIVSRARKIFHKFRKASSIGQIRDNAQLDQKIRALQAQYGNRWFKISELVQVDARVLSDYIRFAPHNNIKKGTWTEEENIKLIDKTKEVLDAESLEGTYRGIDWNQVATHIGNRNSEQCRRHFLMNLAWTQNHDEPKQRWTKENSVSLIERIHSCMYDEGVDQEAYLDWDNIFLDFPNCVSYLKLQVHWSQLKAVIPNYQLKEFQEIVDYLYNEYRPQLLR